MDKLVKGTTTDEARVSNTDADNGSIREAGQRQLPAHLCRRICELAASRELSVESLMESLLNAAPRALHDGVSMEGGHHAALPAVTPDAVVDMVSENRESGGFV
ncbi:MAG: hypothetical protein GVY14_03125 [Spirochaetes bacterium]|jgi:hypothetical protein|nr:hypothetical protein [Spirochaetota bacterium]